MEKYLRDYESLYVRTQKLTDDLEAQVTRNNVLMKEKMDMEKVRFRSHQSAKLHPVHFNIEVGRSFPSCHYRTRK